MKLQQSKSIIISLMLTFNFVTLVLFFNSIMVQVNVRSDKVSISTFKGNVLKWSL